MKVSIILPTYNEKGNIVSLIQDLDRELKTSKYSKFEYLVVDDNSPDGTAEAVLELSKTIAGIRLIVRRDERGLASAVKRGIQESEGDIVVLMDTDYNHQPQDVPRLLEKLPEHDIVIGSRYLKGGRMEYNLIRHYLSYFFNLFVCKALDLKTTDNLSGFIAAKRSVFHEIGADEIFQGFGEYHIPFIWMAHQEDYKITEIPVIYIDRKYGVSKFKAFENLINYTKTVLSLRARVRRGELRKNASDSVCAEK